MNFDEDLRLHYRPGTSDQWVIKEVFEEEVYKLDLPEPPRVIVDIGANIGCSSIYFAKMWPEAKIYAFEPQRENYEIMLLNTSPYRNIFRFRHAISNFNGQANLYAAAEAHKHGYSLLERDSPKELVDVCTLSSWRRLAGIHYIDLLKIDCEGVENKIIQNMAEHHELALVGAIIGEIHGAENLPLLHTLRDVGFQVTAPDDEQIFSALAPRPKAP